MRKKSLPKKLYKYKAFNIHSLRMLTEAEVFYTNPKNFNDPLDCHPDIKMDVSQQELEKLWHRFLIEKHDSVYVEGILGNHRYMATEHGAYNDNANGTEVYNSSLLRDIKEQLSGYFGAMGVFTLAEKWDCPLMWSHYADEHRGICIEYKTENHQCSEIGPVDYNSSRCISVRDLTEWKLNKSAKAEITIFSQYFFAKAPSWKYEKEWRAILNTSGPSYAPFNISAIYFGLRSDPSIQTAIVKLLGGRGINFFSIYSRDDGFKLGRYTIDTDEIEACGVRESPLFIFSDLTKDEAY